MNLVISCDDVFEVLTRGPFPTGDACDEFVDAHLSACHECRQLAEALRPAVDLFQESIRENENYPLPVYLGRYHDGAINPPTSVAPRRTETKRKVDRFSLVGMAGIAVFVLIAFGGLLRDRTNSQGPDRHGPRGTIGQGGAPNELNFAAMGLSLSCFANKQSGERIPIAKLRVEPGADSQALKEMLVCCTRCHHDGGTAMKSPRAMQTVVMACATCHEQPAEVSKAVSQTLAGRTALRFT